MIEKNKCAICEKDEDVLTRDPYSMRYTCKEHEEYAMVGYVELLQIKKGELKKLPEKLSRCQICDLHLTDRDEKLLVNNYKGVNIITCENHKEVQSWYQFDLAKLWFEFKKEFPDAVYPLLVEHEDNFRFDNNNKWHIKFAEWRMGKR